MSETLTANDGSSPILQLPPQNENSFNSIKSASKDSKRRWTKEEDQRLIQAVELYGTKKWKEVASSVSGRTNIQCRYRWHNVLNPELVKGHWTKEEDTMLTEAVEKYGSKNWKLISKCVAGRSNV